jgi:hypothetical protein
MKLKLQVWQDERWQYVFCYNTSDPRGPIIATTRASAALGARDLEYFQNRFGNHQFRVSA